MKFKRIIYKNTANVKKNISDFINRPAFDKTAEESAIKVLDDIKLNGNSALLKYVKKFDGVDLNIKNLKVSSKEIEKSELLVDNDFKKAAKETLKRVTRFAKAGLRKDWKIKTQFGGVLGEKFFPLDRVGVYVPGGTAPLASSVLMSVPLAKVAGVKEIVVCTPSSSSNDISPYILYALKISGVDEVYRVGGIQAIGLMAYGTETIKGVQKIVGPGGPYVTAAKRLVYGNVALDLVAGPSELAILADAKANPVYIAADLLSQAEHGTGHEKILLVTTSAVVADKVEKELLRQSEKLSRKTAVHRVLKDGFLTVVVKNLKEGADICNEFGAEHLELMVSKPNEIVKYINCAGAIFMGKWTPESVGDFVAGPSHVLPTGGKSHMFAGLTVDDFRRRSSVIQYTEKDLKNSLSVVEAFGRVEGLDAHANSARSRFKKI